MSYVTKTGAHALLCDLFAGYLACARCSASGVCLSVDPVITDAATDGPLRMPTTQRCPNCSGAGKVYQHCLDTVVLVCDHACLGLKPLMIEQCGIHASIAVHTKDKLKC